MYDTGTVFRRHIVAGDYAERLAAHFHKLVLTVFANENFLRIFLCICFNKVRGILVDLCRRLYPRHKLFVFHTDKFLACIFTYDTIWDYLVAVLICLHISIFAFCLEISVYKNLSHYNGYLFIVIRVVCLQCHIFYIRTYAKCRI